MEKVVFIKIDCNQLCIPKALTKIKLEMFYILVVFTFIIIIIIIYIYIYKSYAVN